MKTETAESHFAVKGKRRLRITLIRALIVGTVTLAVLGFVLVVGLRWFEHSVSFHPTRYYPADWSPPRGAGDVWFETQDRVRLHSWFFSSKKSPASATIIFFHGNGGNINNVGWLGERLADRGFDVLLLDYRGYGRSEGDVEGERGLYADGDAGYDYITKTKGIAPETVVLYGQSLGTAVATDVASRKKCGALILESGFSSASDLATSVLPMLPRRLHFLMKNRFETTRKLAQVKCPVLITHGEPDGTIPTEHGRRLFAAANEPKKLLTFPGAGHNVFGTMGDAYLDLLGDFVRNEVKISGFGPKVIRDLYHGFAACCEDVASPFRRGSLKMIGLRPSVPVNALALKALKEKGRSPKTKISDERKSKATSSRQSRSTDYF